MAKKERGVITQDAVQSDGSANISLLTANTVYTKSFRIDDADRVAISYMMVNAADSANATIVYEQGFNAPATECAVDVGYVQPVGMSACAISVTTRGSWNHTALFTAAAGMIVLPYGRFKITGNLLNTESVVNIKIHKQLEG